jgi:hypothetical protein
MLTATTLVNGIEELHWILRFRESSFWLTLQLLPDTFDSALNINKDWVADERNVSGTECGAGFTPVADPDNKGPDGGSLVHCTTRACDDFMLPTIGEVEKL